MFESFRFPSLKEKGQYDLDCRPRDVSGIRILLLRLRVDPLRMSCLLVIEGTLCQPFCLYPVVLCYVS